MDEDYLLVEQFQKGNRTMFDTLYEKYQKPIFLFIYRIVSNKEASEDILQEVFLKAFRNLRTMKNKSFRSWLYTIAHHTAIDHIRKHNISLQELDENIHDPTHEGNPEKKLLHKAQQQKIQKVLLRLPSTQRIAILLRDSEGLSYGEIAQILNASESAVKSLLFRARQNFIRLYRDGDLCDV